MSLFTWGLRGGSVLNVCQYSNCYKQIRWVFVGLSFQFIAHVDIHDTFSRIQLICASVWSNIPSVKAKSKNLCGRRGGGLAIGSSDQIWECHSLCTHSLIYRGGKDLWKLSSKEFSETKSKYTKSTTSVETVLHLIKFCQDLSDMVWCRDVGDLGHSLPFPLWPSPPKWGGGVGRGVANSVQCHNSALLIGGGPLLFPNILTVGKYRHLRVENAAATVST